MDLRTKKTLSSIRNTFIELRSKKPLSKITVKELTEKALISKPTFYLHYKDIYDLADSMENEIIDNIISSYPLDFENNNSPYTNWLTSLIQAFISQDHLLHILFSADRKPIFVTKLNSAFKEHLYKIYPHFKDNINLKIYLDFDVNGTFQAYMQNINLTQDKLTNMLVLFNEHLFNSIYELIIDSSKK